MFGSYRSTAYPTGQTLKQIEAGAEAEELLSQPNGGYVDAYYSFGIYRFVKDGKTFTYRDGHQFETDQFQPLPAGKLVVRLHGGPESGAIVLLA